jgi:hypothetical protein
MGQTIQEASGKESERHSSKTTLHISTPTHYYYVFSFSLHYPPYLYFRYHILPVRQAPSVYRLVVHGVLLLPPHTVSQGIHYTLSCSLIHIPTSVLFLLIPSTTIPMPSISHFITIYPRYRRQSACHRCHFLFSLEIVFTVQETVERRSS